MTKTYNDIGAITRLLEEKEKDLELAAQIGKELLEKNNSLETHVAFLESELKTTSEKNAQLAYDLSKKTDLIEVLTNDIDCSCDLDVPSSLNTSKALELMQRKVDKLRNENQSLNLNYSKILNEVNACEDREESLVNDFSLQLATATTDMNALTEDLERQREQNKKQYEEIIVLKSKVSDLELKLERSYNEIEEYNKLLLITKENQDSLTTELSDFKEKYKQNRLLLQETEAQLKKIKGVRSKFNSLLNSNQKVTNLYNELLDNSFSSDTDSGICINSKKSNYKNIFDTVRCASRSYSSNSDTASEFSSLATDSISSMSTNLSFMNVEPIGSCNDNETLTTELRNYPSNQKDGIPGIPGASDLEIALRNLNPVDVNARRAKLQEPSDSNWFSSESFSRLSSTYRTPESIMSTGLSNSSSNNGSRKANWRMPEKLQIIKPIEGSQMLQNWNQLAQPSLSRLLEDRPGTRSRCEKSLVDLLVVNPLDEYEEDVEYLDTCKRYDSFGCIYTYINSTILHPDDNSSVSSMQHSLTSSKCSSVQSSPPGTPRRLSRKNSTCTFSTTIGLAKSLNERELSSQIPITKRTKDELEYTPLSTPCNSPCDSLCSSRSSSPEPEAESSSFGFTNILSSGAELFKRTFVGISSNKKTDKDPKPNSKLRPQHFGLINQMEILGLENIINYPSLTNYPMYRTKPIQYYSNKENKTEKKFENDKALPMEVPGRPGSGILKKRIEQLKNKRRNKLLTTPNLRSDLGYSEDSENELNIEHLTRESSNESQPSFATSTLGSLGTLLFGRKGGFI